MAAVLEAHPCGSKVFETPAPVPVRYLLLQGGSLTQPVGLLRESSDVSDVKVADPGRFCPGYVLKSILVGCRDSPLLGSKRGRCSQEVDLAPRKACVWQGSSALAACTTGDLDSRRFVASDCKRAPSGCQHQSSRAGMSGQLAPVGMERSLSGKNASVGPCYACKMTL